MFRAVGLVYAATTEKGAVASSVQMHQGYAHMDETGTVASVVVEKGAVIIPFCLLPAIIIILCICFDLVFAPMVERNAHVDNAQLPADFVSMGEERPGAMNADPKAKMDTVITI